MLQEVLPLPLRALKCLASEAFPAMAMALLTRLGVLKLPRVAWGRQQGGGGGDGVDWARRLSLRLKRSFSLGELLWRLFGKDLGEFGNNLLNNVDVTYIQL
jgi:hypothetical protein